MIIQNDVGNRFAPTVIVAALTTSLANKPYPTEVRVPAGAGGLPRPSAIRLDQIRMLDKRRLEQYVGQLDGATMHQVNQALMVGLDLISL